MHVMERIATHLGLEDEDGEADEQPVLDNAGDVHGERTGLANQQEHAHVEAERGRGIGQEYECVKVDLKRERIVSALDKLNITFHLQTGQHF
jgi:hypothetical protein